MLVDSHCHLNCLDLSPLNGELSNAIHAARENDVEYFLCVCIDLENFPNVIEIAQQYPQVFCSVGVHPNVDPSQDIQVDDLAHLAQDQNLIAIGETGLDYFRSEGELEWQRQRFRHHIRAARAAKKPLIIHSRSAEEDTVKIMREEKASEIGGVMHCFTGSLEMAQQCLEMGFYISFSGIVTFNNAKSLQQTVQKIPLDRILVETDSPYLAPVPYRGKSNQPAYVRFVAEKIAELYDLPYATIAKQTTDNFFRCFPDAQSVLA